VRRSAPEAGARSRAGCILYKQEIARPVVN
jgi:hypothetical protein